MAVVVSDACPEDRGNGGERDAGGDRGDAVAAAKPPGAPLRALDAGGSHDRAHLAVRGLAGDVPEQAVHASGASLGASEAVHQVDGVHEVLGERHGPPVVSAARQRRDPDLVCSDPGVGSR